MVVADTASSIGGITLIKRVRSTSVSDDALEERGQGSSDSKKQRSMCTVTGCALPSDETSVLCFAHLNEPFSGSKLDSSTGNRFSPVGRPEPLSLLLEDLLQPNAFKFSSPLSSLPSFSPLAATKQESSPEKGPTRKPTTAPARAKSRKCMSGNCPKSAQGKTNFCKAHGGGRRCQSADCTRAARGSTAYCIAHGGGKRCNREGCDKSAVGSTSFCVKHGGGRRCVALNCSKSARGGSKFCARHNTIERKRLAQEKEAAAKVTINEKDMVFPQTPTFANQGQRSAPISPSTELLAIVATSVQRLQEQEQQRQLMDLLDAVTSACNSPTQQKPMLSNTWKY